MGFPTGADMQPGKWALAYLYPLILLQHKAASPLNSKGFRRCLFSLISFLFRSYATWMKDDLMPIKSAGLCPEFCRRSYSHHLNTPTSKSAQPLPPLLTIDDTTQKIPTIYIKAVGCPHWRFLCTCKVFFEPKFSKNTPKWEIELKKAIFQPFLSVSRPVSAFKG